MDVFNTFSPFGYEDTAFNRRISLSRSRARARSVINPYSKPERCGAESFKPFINPITKDVKDSWDVCSKRATKDDVLCSVHRKMLNNACAHGGLVQFKTNVRVPIEAIDKGGCALPAQTIVEAMVPKTKAAAATFFGKPPSTSATKFELNSKDHLKNAFLAQHGS
jgi:hypothetical protein